MLKEQLQKLITKEISFSQMTNEWLAYKRYHIKESTFYRYQYEVQVYLLPYFKKYRLKDFRFFDSQHFMEKLLEKLSDKSVRDILCLLKSILTFAEEKYRYSLYLSSFTLPKNSKEKIKILSNFEKEQLEKACMKDGSYKSLGILICLYTGIRIGEICALKWKHINLKEGVIEIESTLQRIYQEKGKTAILFSSPKTLHSNRTIPLPSKLLSFLTSIQIYEPEAFFLTGSKKQFIEPRNLQYAFRKILKQNNLPEYNFHILRHTFATNCMQVGMDSKSLSMLLGHSNVEITLNRYVHFSYEMAQKYIERL